MRISLQVKYAAFLRISLEGQFLHVTKIMAEFLKLLIDDVHHGVSKNLGGNCEYLLCA